MPPHGIYLTLHADTPPAVRRWLECVEHMARADDGREGGTHAQGIRRFASRY